jgi:hypothetical protein
MDFRLYYRGPLRTNGTAKEKQTLRRVFHPQLRALWDQPPLKEQKLLLLNREGGGAAVSLLRQEQPFTFAFLISEALGLIAELDILFLRPQRPGAIVNHGGDIDNRIRTLLDALRVPDASEIPSGAIPSADEDPFHCLLENDVLITRLAITTDQLLDSHDPHEVVLIIHVQVKDSGTSRFWRLF